MLPSDLAKIYREYIQCLNERDLEALDRYVDGAVQHNGRPIGLSGYREMLAGNFNDIPDLHFRIGLLVCETPYVASRLDFDCTPRSVFLGLPINGRRVSFAENVFYEFSAGKIIRVWSVVDKAVIEAQL